MAGFKGFLAYLFGWKVSPPPSTGATVAVTAIYAPTVSVTAIYNPTVSVPAVYAPTVPVTAIFADE